MTLLSFKMYDKIVVRLKIIKYKKDFFCYLFFYPLGLYFQALYLFIFFFRLHVFKISYFLQMY